jgi:hypothetical protein
MIIKHEFTHRTRSLARPYASLASPASGIACIPRPGVPGRVAAIGARRRGGQGRGTGGRPMRPPRTEHALHALIPAGRSMRPAWSMLPEPTPVIRSAPDGKIHRTFLPRENLPNWPQTTKYRPPDTFTRGMCRRAAAPAVRHLPQVTDLPLSYRTLQYHPWSSSVSARFWHYPTCQVLSGMPDILPLACL